MKTTTRHRLAAAVAGVLAIDGAVHLYWATGAVWPAADARALSFAVLGLEAPFTPRVVIPLAALLLTGAGAVLAYARGRGGRVARLVTGAVAAGLAVRGLAGVGWVAGVLESPADGPFYVLNLLLYTPVCLGLAWAAARLFSSPPVLGAHPAGGELAGAGRRRRTG
ncbi:DUF3995 domain-containing protein [Streptomyces sp. NBC_01351]|uniref:DUF3995 domain-containing protein n=1 Tax=Streptomyces sp. NBC_01351 TaxID=2903833 RepID=UPI002E3380E5|nr:DUF3995 domain-containing protein [Streptomyces sp. NBC_01351]